MRAKKISGLLIAVALCLILSSLITVGVGARGAIDTERPVSMTLTYSYDGHAFEGLEICIYRVAEVSRSCVFALKGDFESYPVLVNDVKTQTEWRQIASTLAGYVTADGLKPTATGSTDGNGNVTFDGLETGLYLVLGCTVDYERGYCTFDSYMLSLPTISEEDAKESWVYDVTARPKSVLAEPGPEDIEYTVNKLWKDSGFEHRRPASVEFGLYKNGELVKDVVLSSENDWTYSWTAPDDGSIWQVVEKNVPDKYSVTIERKGNTFIAANAYGDENPPPVTGDTVDINLYVIVMCIAGVLLLILGIALNRGKRNEKR